jgi:hypothetical protein
MTVVGDGYTPLVDADGDLVRWVRHRDGAVGIDIADTDAVPWLTSAGPWWSRRPTNSWIFSSGSSRPTRGRRFSSALVRSG